MKALIRRHGDLYRIGLHGPDILFYYMVSKNPVTQFGYPACGIMPKMEYARVIHRAIPLVKTINIYISVRMMKILTNFMVCDDHGRKRRILGKLLRLGGESIGSVIEHFMTAEAVEQAKAPMPELERLYREAVPEAVEYLGELYTLREGAYHLSKRWDRTYNG